MKIQDKSNGKFIQDHGLSRHPLYKTFIGMHARCYKENNPKYHKYGGRGIKVCDRWHDIRNFIHDMGEKPTPNHSLDRIDNDGDYSPDNCQWSGPIEQMNNRGILKNNTTGYNGVTFNRRQNKYVARREYKKKPYFLGAFTTAEEAALAVMEFEMEHKTPRWKVGI